MARTADWMNTAGSGLPASIAMKQRVLKARVQGTGIGHNVGMNLSTHA